MLTEQVQVREIVEPFLMWTSWSRIFLLGPLLDDEMKWKKMRKEKKVIKQSPTRTSAVKPIEGKITKLNHLQHNEVELSSLIQQPHLELTVSEIMKLY